MSNLRIRVGAAADANMTTVFQPLIAAAQRARKAVDKEMSGIGVRPAATSFQKVGESGQKATAAIGGAAVDAGKRFEELITSAKKLPPTLAAISAEAQKELKKIEVASARTALGLSGGGGGGGSKFGNRMGYWSMRNFAPVTPTLSIAKNIAGDLARGAGVNTDLGSMVGSYVKRQKLFTDIANTGFISKEAGGTGENANRQDPNALMAQANAIGKANAIDPTQIGEGLQKFVKLTGDLETGRAVLSDMAKLSRATGTEMNDMVSAAGAVSKNLGDVGTAFATSEDKAKAIDAVMRSMAAQGKIGSVDISDLAKGMSKIAAAAGQISGTSGAAKVRNVMIMGALAQEARGVGGAATAPEAANAAMGFVNTMKKGGRIAEFHKAGIATEDATGKIRGPEELILDALSHTKGDTVKMGKLFANVVGGKAVTGFSNIYKDTFASTGGTEKQKDKAGLAAVSKEFDKLMVTMSPEEVQENFRRSMETAEAKAQLFQQRLQELVDKMVERVIPAFEKLTPWIEKAAAAFGDFISWASEHPGEAIGTALAASVSKAGIEQVLRAGIEKAFSGGGGAGGAPGALGNLAAIGTIAALSVTTVKIGEAYIDNLFEKKASAQRAVIEGQIAASNLESAAAASGTVTSEQKRALEMSFGTLQGNTKTARANVESGGGAVDNASTLAGYMLALGSFGLATTTKEVSDAEVTRAKELQRSLDESVAAQQRMARTLEAIHNGTIKIVPAASTSGTMPSNTPVPR